MPREQEFYQAEEGDEAPLCCHKDCAEPAEHQVVILLRPKNYYGPALKIRPLVVVCSAHRPTIPDPFISDDDWLKLVEHVVKAGNQRPHRISTQVEYEPIRLPEKAPTVQ